MPSCVCTCKHVFLFTEDCKSQLCKRKPLSHSLSLSCISFTLLCLSLSSPPSLSFSLAKFHTTCPWQSRFTDYHPLNASHACRWKTLLRHTRTPCSATLAVPVWAHLVGFSLFACLLMGAVEHDLGSSTGRQGESRLISCMPHMVWPLAGQCVLHQVRKLELGNV